MDIGVVHTCYEGVADLAGSKAFYDSGLASPTILWDGYSFFNWADVRH